jgi:hypothetical protein
MSVNGRNLEVVQRVFDTGNDYIHGEREPFERAVEELCARDILVVPSSALASGDPGPFRGREAFLRQQAAVGDTWADFQVTADDFVEVPPSTVVILAKISARGDDGSGYASEVGIVNRLLDGQIVEVQSFPSKRRALEEVGVEIEG